jgi:hypothetical protein
VPVVKSYPHASQKSASATFSVPQWGHAVAPEAELVVAVAGAAGVGEAAGEAEPCWPASIGAPQTSQ